MYENQYCWVEHRIKFKIDKPNIINIWNIPNSGFRSMYQVDNLGKEWIEKNGLRGFNKSGNKVWSNLLFIDFDNNKQKAKDLFNKLKKEGIGFKLYFSGSKGFHFHVEREIEPSIYVPNSDKVFVKNISIGADISIYSHLHPFRIAGTLHEKTGKLKKLLYENKGKKYKINIIKSQEKNKYYSIPEISIFLDETIMSFSLGFKEGKRNYSMCFLGKLLKERGESVEFIQQWILNANLMNNPPLENEEINKIIEWLRN